MATFEQPILNISNLSLALVDKKGRIQKQLTHNITLSIQPGEMLGLVGESGSGKSITSSAVLGLLPPNIKIISGSIELNGRSLISLSEKEKRHVRGKQIAYISQNYQGSFTPFFKIGKQLVEAIRSHEQVSIEEAKELALTWLEHVKLPAERVYNSYPFQLSGGQLQRASLAAALMMKPELIIADEPTTALDVLNGEQILDLLMLLQQETGCAVLFISHNLTHILKRTDRMVVMYGGHILESGTTAYMQHCAEHPYTQLLLQARPTLTRQTVNRLATIPGEAGAVSSVGCPFSLRCPLSTSECTEMPLQKEIRNSHYAACHLAVHQEEKLHEAVAAN